jgi:hypothetical protein
MKTVLVLLVLALAGCGIRVYGNLKCEGPCELTIDREVKELDPMPFDPVTKPVKEK